MISLQKIFRKRLQDKYLNQLHLYAVILSNWTAVDDKSASASCWLKCGCNTETLKRANEMGKKKKNQRFIFFHRPQDSFFTSYFANILMIIFFGAYTFENICLPQIAT